MGSGPWVGCRTRDGRGWRLGLPCSTAVALVGGGVDRGVDFAVKMSGDSLLGLAGAEALPMAYSRAIGRGWKLRWALGFAVGSYLLVAIVAGRLLPSSGDGSLAVAALAVLSAVWITGRISPGDSTEPPAPSNSPGRRFGSPGRWSPSPACSARSAWPTPSARESGA